MIKETMTSEERILAAINLEPYDRVPVVPHLNGEFPFRQKGLATAEVYKMQNLPKIMEYSADLYDEVGGWDGLTMPLGGGLLFSPALMSIFAVLYGDTMKFPGGDDRLSEVESTPQYAERVLITPDHFDEIIEQGWSDFSIKNLHLLTDTFFGIPLNALSSTDIQTAMRDSYLQCLDFWAKKKVPLLSATTTIDPQMMLSMLRTLTEFTLDLYRCPEKVHQVLKSISKDFAKGTIEAMAHGGPAPISKIPGVMMACERGSGTYFNLGLYEKYIWPFMKEQILSNWENGYVTTLHMDTDWTLNLPYLLELPAKSCIVELDSTSNIFKAKEILGKHMCIMGDIPPALSSHGTPEEMRAYCEQLIKVVGKDTGFILSTGCAVPPNTKLENFKVMIDSVKTCPPGRS